MDWSKEVIDLATAAGFAGLVWYLVVRHIPAITQLHQAERKEWLDYIRMRDAKYESLVEKCLAAIEIANHRPDKS